jgi:hypothetical protein
MNLLGLEFSSVGNHEFDRGGDELKRMQTGGWPTTHACAVSRLPARAFAIRSPSSSRRLDYSPRPASGMATVLPSASSA